MTGNRFIVNFCNGRQHVFADVRDAFAKAREYLRLRAGDRDSIAWAEIQNGERGLLADPLGNFRPVWAEVVAA